MHVLGALEKHLSLWIWYCFTIIIIIITSICIRVWIKAFKFIRSPFALFRQRSLFLATFHFAQLTKYHRKSGNCTGQLLSIRICQISNVFCSYCVSSCIPLCQFSHPLRFQIIFLGDDSLYMLLLLRMNAFSYTHRRTHMNVCQRRKCIHMSECFICTTY